MIFIKEFYSIKRSNQIDSISSIKNLNDLNTNKLFFVKFSFQFNQIQKKYEYLLNNNNKSDDNRFRNEKNNLLNKLSTNFDSKKCVQNFKSILHYNWINEIISSIYFKDRMEADLNNNNNKQAKNKLNNDSIEIELAFYDQNITQL